MRYKSRTEKNMESVWLKFILVIIVFLITVGSGYLAFHSGGKEEGSLNCYFCNVPLDFAECFGAGIFLGAGLIHMLGDAQTNFIESGQTYPTGLVVCGSVFLGFLLMEHYGARLAADSNSNNNNSSKSKSKSNLNSNNTDNQANGSEEIESSQSSKEGIKFFDSPQSNEDIELTLSPNSQENPVLVQDPESENAEFVQQKKLMSPQDKVLPLSVLVMLSIHSVLMGLAFGVTSSATSTFVIFIAVIAHKGSASFALALELTKSTFTKSFAWKLFLVFTLMFPFGALLGSILSKASDGHSLYEATFSAIAAGTFLFFGTLHGLSTSALVDKCQNFNYFFGVVVGFTVMAIVAIWL